MRQFAICIRVDKQKRRKGKGSATKYFIQRTKKAPSGGMRGAYESSHSMGKAAL